MENEQSILKIQCANCKKDLSDHIEGITWRINLKIEHLLPIHYSIPNTYFCQPQCLFQWMFSNPDEFTPWLQINVQNHNIYYEPCIKEHDS